MPTIDAFVQIRIVIVFATTCVRRRLVAGRLGRQLGLQRSKTIAACDALVELDKALIGTKNMLRLVAPAVVVVIMRLVEVQRRALSGDAHGFAAKVSATRF